MKVSIHDQMPNPIYLRSHQNQVVNTPYKVVKSLLDSLPSHVWSQKDLRWLMPVSKSGAFEIEVFRRLFVGLKDVIVDPIERRDWIVQKMIHSFCASKATEALTKRNFIGQVYGVKKYDGIDCNIWIVDFMKTKVNKQTGEIVAQTTDGEKKFVKFDCIVGNPPYQDNSPANDPKNIYPDFVLKAIECKPRYMSMVILARWMMGSGKEIESFLKTMIDSKSLSSLTVEEDAKKWFPDVAPEGGIMHFLYDNQHNSYNTMINGIEANLEGEDCIISNALNLQIKKKVMAKTQSTFDKIMLGSCPFDIRSSHKNWALTQDNAYVCHNSGKLKTSAPKITFIDKLLVKKNKQYIDKYKVCIGCGYGSDGTSHPFIIEPDHVVSQSYLVMFCSDDKNQCQNVANFLSTHFAQFLVSLLKNTQNIAKRVFKYMPYLDFSKSYTDQELYTMFELTQEEIKHIEETTKDFPMFKVKVERKTKKVKKEEKIAAAEIAA